MTTTKLFDISENVAVITGGNGGIGRSIELGLSEAGASVTIFGRNEEKNENTLSELREIGILASRMEQLNKKYKSQLLISEEVLHNIRLDGLNPESLDSVEVKGIEKPIHIYRLA